MPHYEKPTKPPEVGKAPSKSPEAERAVTKPKVSKETEGRDIPWKGGVDRFDERV